MNLFVSKIINSIIEIIVFGFIPFLWWFITARKACSFFQWIGLKPVDKDKRKPTLICGAAITGTFLLLSVYMLWMIRGVEAAATSEFSGLGVRALPAVLVYALFNTALPEEILFRGFLLKRISSKAGFVIGNVVQAILFGILHGIMFVSHVGMAKGILIILLTGCIAWFMGYVNERRADGSILPSWIIHTVSNVFSGLCSAFLLI